MKKGEAIQKQKTLFELPKKEEWIFRQWKKEQIVKWWRQGGDYDCSDREAKRLLAEDKKNNLTKE